MDLKLLLEKAIPTVLQVGEFIKQERIGFDAHKVSDKSLNQLVSYVDIEAEKQLVEGLSKVLPSAGFIGEEGTSTQTHNTEYTWVIDPLDGTTNFIHGLPVYCISVGLLHEKEPVIGIVFEMNRNELFTAYQNGGAWLNKQQISVTKTPNLKDTLLATGFPYYDFDKTQSYLKVLNHLMKNTRGLRRMGSAAVDLAYTACGRFDAYFEYSLSPWDVAGGACLVKEAGGIVCDFKGEDNYLFGKEILACNPFIAEELKRLLWEGFY